MRWLCTRNFSLGIQIIVRVEGIKTKQVKEGEKVGHWRGQFVGRNNCKFVYMHAPYSLQDKEYWLSSF
jgi:hypothetical protein